MFSIIGLNILGFFKNIFSDWRAILIVVILAIAGLIAWKFHEQQVNLTDTIAKLHDVEANNQTLTQNLNTAVAVNSSNQVVINQMTADKNILSDVLSKLSTQVTVTNKNLSGLQNRIDQLKVPTAPLTPYLVEAIKGVQQERTKPVTNNPLPVLREKEVSK